jgi:hypothetical protein
VSSSWWRYAISPSTCGPLFVGRPKDSISVDVEEAKQIDAGQDAAETLIVNICLLHPNLSSLSPEALPSAMKRAKSSRRRVLFRKSFALRKLMTSWRSSPASCGTAHMARSVFRRRGDTGRASTCLHIHDYWLRLLCLVDRHNHLLANRTGLTLFSSAYLVVLQRPWSRLRDTATREHSTSLTLVQPAGARGLASLHHCHFAVE